MDKSYYRVTLGSKHMMAEDCLANNYIGGNWGVHQDLSMKLPEDWRDFNKEFIPIFLAANPQKSRIASGLACSMLYNLCKAIHKNDIIIVSDGKGIYHAGKVASDYYYNPDTELPHRRKIEWFPITFTRENMSDSFMASISARATLCQINKHGREIESLLQNKVGSLPDSAEEKENIEDSDIFGLEKHLEEFLVQNWDRTPLGKKYEIYKDDNGDGQQYRTDTGRIDILAISHDKKEILVVELKKGRAADVVVGQTQRYMGYVIDELASPEQTVSGLIIALEDSKNLRRALRATQNINFYRYHVSFRLFPS